MHVVDAESIELDAYQLKGIGRTWFDQWKEGKGEDAPLVSWDCFEEAFFSWKLREDKVYEFLILKQDLLSVHEYGLKFTQLSLYAPEMVKEQNELVYCWLGPCFNQRR